MKALPIAFLLQGVLFFVSFNHNYACSEFSSMPLLFFFI